MKFITNYYMIVFAHIHEYSEYLDFIFYKFQNVKISWSHDKNKVSKIVL